MQGAKHSVVLILLLFLFSYGVAASPSFHVEKTYYLQGKVGKREVVVKMLCYDESPIRQLHYFFQDAKRDRFLAGNFKDNVWNFIPEPQQGAYDKNSQESLRMTETRTGAWQGTWTDSTGKSQDIVLQPISDFHSPKFSDLPFVQELDPYESYRLFYIQFTKTGTEKRSGDLWCDWYLEKESGISFFRMRPANSKVKTDSINVALETIHLSLVQKYFSYAPHKVDTKVETSLLYLNPELASFQILSTTIFKEGKTSPAKELLTLDMKSGQQVNLEDIIWFDKGATKPDADDLFKIYKYRKNVFAPKVFALLQQLYPGKMKTDSCQINKTETWALPAWSVTGKGIAFGFHTPMDCDVQQWAVIPYDMLAPFMEERYHPGAKK